ncbi:hypothetical protein TNIN_146481 [Trichonephila inaurata madagascariensis]|uniref:Uncharacterized protein n=1 Tax=Trichonephila inaurata madagascariensis TaxID=2747483 RepID=A0A8X6XAU9_9ARAC|nr:hypothetical protein TNIN_146481 [Trichonephila inaurata madagascariensis]
MNTKCPLVFQKGTYGEELYHRFLCAREARIYSYRNAWSTRNADDIYQRYRFKAESKERAPETRNGINICDRIKSFHVKKGVEFLISLEHARGILFAFQFFQMRMNLFFVQVITT